ncbi:hypothetical protein [Pseudomonas citronellolis]|uniref:hypothetical protein n=1 Tax=Pseudomonas citronellolis TaxID=53408 RepID=UPI0023E41709|nr:hypothetical protein [Pseudomonas citronellolis]MDF3932155.1 hypothetical protein [Pseudomonas citronellolis]
MIESNFTIGDEIDRFGITAHGLALNPFYGENKLRVGSLDFPMPYVWSWSTGESGREPFDVHLLRVPGVPAVDITPEDAAAEALHGRTWQNYALLSESVLTLVGKPLRGWVCIDELGARWLVRADPGPFGSTVDVGAPLAMDVSVRPFGYLDQSPVTPFTKSVTLADIGQSSGAAPPGTRDGVLELWVCSVSSDGRRMIMELRGVQSPAVPATLRINTAPAGFLLLELSGSGPDFELSLTVLKTRLECLGTMEVQRSSPKGFQQSIAFETTSTPRTINGVAGKDYICNAVDVIGTELPSRLPYAGTGWIGEKLKNRIMALVFDETDTLVELAYEANWRVDYNYPAFTGAISGAISGWMADSVDFVQANVTNTIVGEYSRASSEVLYGEVALLRDGVEVVRDGFRMTRALHETFRYNPSYTQTPSVERLPSGDVVGGGYVQDWQYDFTDTQQSAGATWPIRTFSNGPNWSIPYNGPVVWSGMTGSPTPVLSGYGVSLSYGNTSTNDYSGAEMALQRYSHSLFGVRERATAGTLPQRWRVGHLIGPRGLWANPDSQDATGARRATYHPVTHEIYTTASDSDSAAFCWI